jgi:hypothetical protein
MTKVHFPCRDSSKCHPEPKKKKHAYNNNNNNNSHSWNEGSMNEAGTERSTVRASNEERFQDGENDDGLSVVGRWTESEWEGKESGDVHI